MLLAGYLVFMIIFFEFIGTHYFHSYIKHKLTTYLNQKLVGELVTDDITFSFIRGFPDGLMTIEGLKVVQEGEEVFSAGLIEIHLDLPKMVDKQIEVSHLIVRNARFVSHINKEGRKHGIKFIKGDGSSNFPFTLDSHDVELYDSYFVIINDFKKNRFQLNVTDALLNMHLDSNIFRLSGDINGILDTLISNGDVLFKNRALRAEGAVFTVDNHTKIKTIEKGSLVYRGAKFDVHGTIVPADSGNIIDITFNGSEDIQSFLALLPEETHFQFEPIDNGVLVNLTLHQHGFTNPFSIPQIDIDFKIENAGIRELTLPKEINDITLIGSFTNGEDHSPKTTRLEIEVFKATMNENFIDARLIIEDFTDPVIHARLKSELDIETLQGFFSLPDIEQMNGMVDVDFKLDGKLSDLEFNKDIEREEFKGNIEFKNASLLTSNSKIHLKGVSGKVYLDNHEVIISALEGILDNSEFKISGKVENYLPLFLANDSRPVVSKISIEVNELDLDKYENKSDSKSLPEFPEKLETNLSIKAGRISTGGKSAENINARVRLSKDTIIIEQLNLTYNKGRINLAGVVWNLANDETGVDIWGSADFPSLDFDLSDTSNSEMGFPKEASISCDLTTNSLIINDYSVGSFSSTIKYKNEQLSFENLLISRKDGYIAGNGSVENLKDPNPLIKGNFRGNFESLNLDELPSFGTSNSGSLPQNIDLQAVLRAKKLIYKERNIENFSVNLEIKPGDLNVERLAFQLPGGHFETNFQLIQRGGELDLKGEGGFDFTRFDLDVLEETFGKKGKSGAVKTDVNWGNIEYNLTMVADQATIGDFTLSQVSGNVDIINDTSFVHHLQGNIFKGQILIGAKIYRDDKDHFYIHSLVDGFEIKAGSFLDNYVDQPLLTSEHFRGIVNLEADMIFSFDHDLQHKPDDVLGKVNMDLENVEIIDFTPVTEALKFVRKGKKEKILLANSDLQFYFHNNELIVPHTYFRTTLSDMELFAIHNLDETIILDLKISLGELFFRSQKRKHEEFEEGVKNELGGLDLHLSAQGDHNDLKWGHVSRRDYESSEVAVNIRLREIEKLLLESHLLDREIGVVLNQ